MCTQKDGEVGAADDRLEGKPRARQVQTLKEAPLLLLHRQCYSRFWSHGRRGARSRRAQRSG